MAVCFGDAAEREAQVEPALALAAHDDAVEAVREARLRETRHSFFGRAGRGDFFEEMPHFAVAHRGSQLHLRNGRAHLLLGDRGGAAARREVHCCGSASVVPVPRRSFTARPTAPLLRRLPWDSSR